MLVAFRFIRVLLVKIDERGTLKATEHDKYENIAKKILQIFARSK
jgi:hypothetical protein